MNQQADYGTITEAIDDYKQQGYKIDFNLKENFINASGKNYLDTEAFEIVGFYRYEGNSDPGDESTVYAIESKSGKKGILVSGYGIDVDTETEKMLAALQFKKQHPF
jgi:hypothetical protein